MEAHIAELDSREDLAASGSDGGGGGGLALGASQQLIDLGVGDRDGAAAAGGGGGGGVLGTLRQPIDIGDHDGPAGGGGGWLGLGALQELVELEDRRLKAAGFFLACGCGMVMHGTVPNSSANPEHVLAGFVMLSVGAALTLLTLRGGRAGRAAARLEEALRGFFF